MEMLDMIKARKSCRSYKKEMVKEEDINKIVEAGLHAANGMGFQKGIIVAITNKELRDELSNLNAKIIGDLGHDPFYGAPVVLLVACEKWRNAPYDGACMMQNMLLEASALGLGSCWIHRAKEELEKEEGIALFQKHGIDLTNYEGIGHVIVGYIEDELPKKEIKANRVYYIK